MNSIMINSISGIYQELYNPEPELLSNSERVFDDRGIFDANMLFWRSLLSRDNINKTVNLLLQKISDPEHIPVSYKAIVAEPDNFIEKVLHAKVHVADQGIDVREFFSYVETLNIFCRIYSWLFFERFMLTIQQGWILQEDSALDIYQNCLDETQNPYLSFIENNVLPLIKKSVPKVVFLLGRPGYFFFTLSRFLKQIDSTIFICITRHSSEYYSLNKIDFLLRKNTYLFRVIDAIILEHFFSTEQEIIASIYHNKPINTIKNLICMSDSGIIQHTGYQCNQTTNLLPDIQRRSFYNMNNFHIPPHTVANVHLFPNVKCYWNQCNFCGINKKYHFDNPLEMHKELNIQFNTLRELVNSGISRIWFIDEAIPHNIMHKIAIFFIQADINVTWQARCRIEAELLNNNLPEILAESGLRELRLGLESGSESVLKKMNKFDDTFSFQLVNDLCHRFSNCGISLHFPMIIGFPCEGDSERRLTYELLIKLSEQYPLITFNINIFGLDVSSKIFRNWVDFDVQSLSFPCEPAFYLGNILNWHSPNINYNELLTKRDQLMREKLYSWMPSHAFTKPHILYRLSETIRNTLIWKETTYSSKKNVMPSESINERQYKVSNLTIFYDEKITLYYIYSWSSHHYMLGNSYVITLLEIFKSSETMLNALDILRNQISCEYTNEDFKKLIEKLVFHQYLVEVKQV